MKRSKENGVRGEMADWQLENMAMPDDDSQEEEATLTHQERAERVRELLRIPPNKTFRVTPGEWRYATNIIAREMFPRELVEAARWLLGRCEEMDWPDSELDQLRAVLSLYPEPEEETTS